MKVLSLFDGISCGYVALERAGVPIDVYFASEIDKHAIKVAMKNHPDIVQLGDVCEVKWDKLPPIDLIIGGSPCQWFSMAGKMLNFEDPRSKLFFEFVRLVKECKPKYFLLENVKMKKDYIKVITEQLWGVEPTLIDSALVSAQRRKRLYRVGKLQEDWTYAKVEIPQPEDKWILLKDILLEYVEPKYDISEKHTIAMKNARSCGELNLPKPDEKCWTIIAWYYKTPQDWPYILKDYELTESQKKNYERDFGSKWKILDDVEWKCPTLTASMGTWWWNVPAILKNYELDDRQVNMIANWKWYEKPLERVKWPEDKMDTLTTHCGKMSNGIKLIRWRPKMPYEPGHRTLEYKEYEDKCPTLTTSCASGDQKNIVVDGDVIRKLHPIECERLQTLPDGYTEWISDSQRYKALGNWWTVDVIAHIFKCLFN